MPIARFEMPDGRIGRFEVPEGTTPEQAQELIAQSFKTEPSAAVEAGKAVNSIPRQLGLTARYGLEGLANTAQLVTEPVRQMVTDPIARAFGGKSGRPLGEEATRFADYLGLPQPQGADERVVGDATRLVAGTAGLGGAARAAQAVPGMVGDAASFLSANMPQQLFGAAGAGLAGGASREAGGSPLMQAGAATLGTLAGGLTASGAASLADSAGAAGRRIFNRLTPQQMDQQISAILQRGDVDYSALPNAAKAALRNDLESALRAGKELSPDAVRRLADFRIVGATPTRGMVSQNPVQITREMNLAKTGANTSDDSLHGLALLQNQNNNTFIRNLNDAGAGRGDPITAGRTLTSSVTRQRDALRNAETRAWDAAKGSPGYQQPISPAPLNDINKALGDEALMPFMNPNISKYMEAFQTGQQPFTPQHYRNLQSMLSREMAKGGNEAAAAGAARRVLDNAELSPLTQTGSLLPATAVQANKLRGMDRASSDALSAVDNARQSTKAAYAFEESTPMVRSILSDSRTADPERIASSFIINGTAREAAQVANQLGPENIAPVRDALLAHLKRQATNGAQDETAKFSASAFGKALDKIGPEKLRMFFAPEEIQQLNALRRVSALAVNQPTGSAVNNSNSGALLLGKGYDSLMALGNKLPVIGPMLVPPVKNIEIAVRNRQAQNVVPGLLSTPEQTNRFGQGLLLPFFAGGGLLAGSP